MILRRLRDRWQLIKDEAAEGSNVVGENAVEAPFLGGTLNDLTHLQASWWGVGVAVLAQQKLTIVVLAAVRLLTTIAKAHVAVVDI